MYGATGAGKTHTMLGNDTAPGIIYLTMRSLYHEIEGMTDKHFDIGISYLEVRLISLSISSERRKIGIIC